MSPLRGEIGLAFDGMWTETDVLRRTSRRTLYEGVSVGGDGQWSRLMTFEFLAAPLFSQSRFSDEPVREELLPRTDSDQLYGFAKVKLLPHGTFSLDGFVRRTWTNQDVRAGNRRDLDRTRAGAELFLNSRALPSRLLYQFESDIDIWSGGARAAGRVLDQDRHRVRLQARNSKTGLFVQNLAVTDNVAGFDYTLLDGRFDHRLSWGKGSSLRTNLYYSRRSQFADARSLFTWQEYVLLQHTGALSSNWGLNLQTMRTGPFSTDVLGGDGGVHYALTRSLRFRVTGLATGTAFSGGASRSRQQILPGVSFSSSVLRGLSVYADGALGYEWRHFKGTNGAVGTVVDERHVIDDGLTVSLNEENVIPQSIIVRNPDDGTLFEVGIDYTIRWSPLITDLLILPSGRLVVGDVIVVDYAYAVEVDREFNGPVARYDVGVRTAGLDVYHRRVYNANTEDLVAEGSSRDQLLTGVSLSFRTSLNSLIVRAEHSKLTRGALLNEWYRVTGSSTSSLAARLTGTLRGSWSRSRDNLGLSNTIRADAILRWFPVRRASVWLRVSGWEVAGDRIVDRGYFGGGVGSSVRWYAWTGELRYERFEWSEVGQRLENRFVFAIRRAF